MRKTVAIMTYWQYNDNYGQILQAYALSHYIESLGYDVKIIKYCHLDDNTLRIDIKTRIINQLKKPKDLLKILWKRVKTHNNKNLFVCPCEKEFLKFKNLRFHWTQEYKTFQELKENSPKADVYVCGSDMIWAETAYYPNPFLLDFGSPKKRIAYAPSFGRKTISKFHRDLIRPLLERFNNISLREKSGEEICKNMGFPNAVTVPDPTLLLKKEDYYKLEEPTKVDGKYAFVYLLGGEIELSPNEIKAELSKNNLKMIYRSAQGRVDDLPKVYPSPGEWLNYIHNAEIVITNSFHGVVLSIIYGIPFIYFPLVGASFSTNERVFNLLQRLGLEGQIYKSDLNLVQKLANISTVYTESVLGKVNTFKLKGENYLVNSLSLID